MDEANNAATSNLDSLGLAHSLVLFWIWQNYSELKIEVNGIQYIGCDEHEESLLSRYATRFAGCTIKPLVSDGVIARVFKKRRPEMSPNISYYSKEEHPHRDFALSCGILASFCFPLRKLDNDDYFTMEGVLEIVSTRNQDVGAVRKFCEFFKEFNRVLDFRSIHMPKYAVPEIEPKSFTIDICKSNNALPHHDGSGYTPTLNLFQNGTEQSSNSERIPNEVTQINQSDEPLKELINEDTGYAKSNEDIRNAMTTASQPSRSQTKKTLCQQQEETMFFENEGDTSQQLPRASQLLFEDGNEQAEQVLDEISTPKTNSYEENSTAATSKRTPEVDELDRELPVEYNEPQFLTSQLRRSEEIIGDEGYTFSSKRGGFVVTDEDVENKRLKKSIIPLTKENIINHFGMPLKDAAKCFGFSISTFKRRCRDVGISWWQPGKSKIIDGEPGGKNFSSDMPNVPNRPDVTHASQDSYTMTVKVTYNTEKIRFELPSSSGIAELENSVIERLPLDTKSFSLKYQDDKDDWILISCDKDVQECMKLSRSLGKPIIKMLIGPPIVCVKKFQIDYSFAL